MKPETEPDLCEAVQAATGPLWIRGGGTHLADSGADQVATPLDTSALTGITLYEPGALTIVARSGTSVVELSAALAAEGQCLPFEPADYRGLLGTRGEPTIGGVVAGNLSGPRRVQAGACRDSLIGVRFVDGRGTAIKNGGRVMKNVTGYDLVKLMCGSWGTLGVLSEVGFKVLPAPETSASLMIHGLDDAAAVRAMSTALGSPFEVSAAAHIPAHGDDRAVTLLRVEGFATSVSYRVGRLRDLLGGFGETSVEDDPDQVRESWAGIRDAAPLHGFDGDIWRVSVKPSDGPVVGAAMPNARLLYDWGGGLIWAGVAAGTDLRGLLTVSGHATLVKGTGQPRFHPEAPAVAALAAGLRAQFDPRGILNPGLMG